MQHLDKLENRQTGLGKQDLVLGLRLMAMLLQMEMGLYLMAMLLQMEMGLGLLVLRLLGLELTLLGLVAVSVPKLNLLEE